MLYIDSYVHNNGLHKAHPLERFLFSVWTLLFTIIVTNPFLQLSVAVVMVGLLIGKARIPARVVIKLMTLPLFFLFLGAVTIACVWGKESTGMWTFLPLGSYYLGVTETSIMLAGLTVLKSLSALSCMFFLALTTPLVEIIYILRLLRLPDVVCELMLLIYRFIFILLETALQIYTAQASRWGYSNFKGSLYSLGLLFANLWRNSFFQAQDLYMGLSCRGYDGQLRFLNPHYTFSLHNIALFVSIDLVLLVAAVL